MKNEMAKDFTKMIFTFDKMETNKTENVVHSSAAVVAKALLILRNADTEQC